MEKSRGKLVKIPVTTKSLFKSYLSLTKPINKLGPKEIDVLSLILYYNHIEKPNFKRDEDRWRKVFDYDTKMLIKEELEMKDYSLQNILSSLRRKKVVKNNVVMPYYIPDIDNSNTFKLVFQFNISNG